MKIQLLCLAFLTLAVAAFPVHAGIPGGGTSVEVRKNDVLLHVCARDREVVCVERDETVFAHPFTGVECEAVGLVPECVVSFVQGSEIRGTLVVSADENTTTGEIPVTLTYRFRVAGKDEILSETYPPGTRVGNWNPIVAESQIFALAGVGQFLDGELQAVADELTRLVGDWLARRHRELPDSVPVLARIERVDKLDSDHSSAGSDPLGSAATYLVEFRFARVQP
jgi:hypothetical protein